MRKIETKTKADKFKKTKICLVCSAGGHLTEMLQIGECYENRQHFFITFKRKDTKELGKKHKTYFVRDPKRGVLDLFSCVHQTLRILAKERPDIIVSTGAGVAIPACYLGKMIFGSKIVFIESFCRIETPSLSGRLAYPVSDLFFVQWKELLGKYGNNAIYRGSLL